MNESENFPPVASASSSQGVKLKVVVLAVVFAMLAGFFFGREFYKNPQLAGLDYSELDEIYSVLQENYDGEIDNNKLIEGAKRGMVEGLGDDYTQYFSEEESEEFKNSLEGSFEGIGAELLNKDGKLTIVNVLEDSPAKKSGLKNGDIISKVDDEEVITWSAEKAVQIIRGKAGTTVRLSIVRGSELLNFDIVRGEITSPSVNFEINDGIAYMQITRFGDTDTMQLARRAAKQFVDAGVKGIVLDLRGNGGGYVSTAVGVASLWLDKGAKVVIEKTGDIVTQEETATGNNILGKIPTIVLIDGGSASASEIVAGALSDHGKAKLLGEKSYGKGSVQMMKELDAGDQVKVTVAKWYTPKGINIDKEGITPTIEVKFDSEAYKKTGTDNQRQKAVEILK